LDGWIVRVRTVCGGGVEEGRKGGGEGWRWIGVDAENIGVAAAAAAAAAAAGAAGPGGGKLAVTHQRPRKHWCVVEITVRRSSCTSRRGSSSVLLS
jgi:hypothetical protein